ncbi:MAG: ATP-binding cassette domain-containing protein [Desulfobacterales bacterium]|jgi:ABC-type Fe3+/spermidine/putrescine transport system ATPase subunit|nr:ATP-binding cassette domain-containing protein [Desulfobacterales bacterium]
MSKKLVLENVSKHFGSLIAVNNVSLEIEPGEFLCFLGPSGCGKTTILRMITGFEQATSGNIIYDGKIINDVIPQKRDFGIVFQSYALFPNMTVNQNIAFGLKMRKVPQKLIDERMVEILALLGLTGWERHYPSQLSGGQQQRVALGRAIAINPNVLLLDEPLSALDAKIRLRLRTVIKRLQEELGVTMIYVTHDQEEALALADRVVIMRDGEIRQIGTPLEIYKEPKTSFIAEFVGTSNFLTCTKKNGKIQFGKLEFMVPDLADIEKEEIYLAVRPENIELVDVTVSGENCVPSNVVDVEVEVVNFLGAIVRIAFFLEGEEMFVDVPEKEFAKIRLKRKDKMKLYFPPDAFYVYTEMFRKLI